MDHAFWLKRWDSGQIGFHADDTHPMLLRHWDDIHADPSGAVFVPLCGKSNDMLWLREKGHDVAGSELSAIAVSAFFNENAIDSTLRECGPFTCHVAPGYRLLCGDFFDLTPDTTGQIGAVYDRAALIALSPEQRADYVAHLAGLLVPGTQILLVTVQYDPDLIAPPPFSIGGDEVARLYDPFYVVDRLSTAPAVVKEKPCEEVAYRMARK